MLGLRARRQIGSTRFPVSAKGQTTPVPARDQLCGPKCDGFVIAGMIVRIRRSPSKIFLEPFGNARVESKATNWIDSIPSFGERADDSRPRERSTLRAKV